MDKKSLFKIICGILSLVFVLSSCNKLSPRDLIMPDVEMPGFGNNDDNIQGTAFPFPAKISIDGQIKGGESYSADTILGSGGLVTILVPLKNDTSVAIWVEFPAAMVFQCNSTEYQNGLLLKKVRILVRPGKFYVALKLYCCNMGRHASSASAGYQNPVVCTTSEIVQLCDKFKNKAINYGENQANYSTNQNKIQDIVWHLTQYGKMPSSSDLDFINSLPNGN